MERSLSAAGSAFVNDLDRLSLEQGRLINAVNWLQMFL